MSTTQNKRSALNRLARRGLSLVVLLLCVVLLSGRPPAPQGALAEEGALAASLTG